MTLCVVDTHLLGFPTPRRFLMGMAVLLEQHFYATDEVVRETQITAGKRVGEYWSARLRKSLPDLPDHAADKAVDAAERASAEWCDLFFSSHPDLIQVLSPSSNSCHIVSAELPDNVLSGKRSLLYSQDRAIICQVLAGGADMFLTSNTNTIRHSRLNRWVLESGRRNASLVFSPGDGLEVLCEGRYEELIHRASIAMTLPEIPRSPEEELGILLQFAQDLESNIAGSGEIIQDEEITNPSSSMRWQLARESIGHHQWKEAREIEANRLSMSRNAVQTVVREKGFDLEICV